MTTYPLIGATADATVLPQGAADLLAGDEENIWCTSQDGLSKYYVAGALKPWPGIQDGILLVGGLKGLTPNFKHLDLKAARQPGVTWTGTVYDVLEMDMQLEAHANTPQGISQVVSEWVSMWTPEVLNTVEYWTIDRSYWYLPARRSKPWPDVLKQMPRLLRMRSFTQTIRCDSGFWFGMPSIDTFQPGGSGGSGWLRLMNIGNQPGWPTIMFTGPGTVSFSNGPAQNTNTMITFGPLEAGQKVLITTRRRLRNIVDLTNTTAAQPNTPTAALLSQIINFVTNNNVPPLLQWFESRFGVLPPQGPLYSLLSGQYTNPIPGVRQPSWAQQAYIAVSITGGNSDSQVVGRIDPQRDWPE
ncbi:hypothetical protein [Mycobacterium malmoense]|uniref:hypothetical protein n=1 Tax=Mycobacterium malmoense TaxID=1780 RepID=UPI0008F81433|nr:hypothetical protein [Mycobacterium malmoense]OIN79770.1 hypothetical protein BMG05_16625 [Mycobacterium malmoense]